mgnify:CR=1 FL=1
MTPERTPSIRLRRLGLELRKLRERSGYSTAEVGAHLGWSSSKISRIETAQTTPKIQDVVALLNFYGADPDTSQHLIRMAENPEKKGWWERYGVTGRYAAYIELEDAADEVSIYSQGAVPGLLQTSAYAREVLRTSLMGDVPESEIDRRVEIRTRRQTVLRRESPLVLSVVLDECAVRRTVGNPDVLAEQLEYLIAVSELPNVTLRVLPFTCGAHPAMNGSFTILRFADTQNWAAAAIEVVGSTVWVEDETDVHHYTRIYRALLDQAASSEESAALLRDIIDTLRRENA